MLDKIKFLLYHPGLGIALCVVALFLVANSVYLNSVRDQKAESLAAIEESMSSYQESLEHQGKGTPQALKPFIGRFHYGQFLKMALAALEKSPNLSFTGIHLDVEELSEHPSGTESSTFPFTPSSRSKKKPEKIEVLTLSGEVKNMPKAGGGPYQQLNEMIAQIEADTHCQWVLTQAGEALGNTDEQKGQPKSLQFALTLRPKRQPECVKHYSQTESE